MLRQLVTSWTVAAVGRSCTRVSAMGIKELRTQGREVSDDLLSFIAPGHRENINFFGFIEVDIERRTRQA